MINPFTYGNPIKEIDRFVGRSNELNQIFMRLRNPAFESTAIVGERRIGKSSLLTILSQQPFDPKTYFVNIDLQMVEASFQPKDFWVIVLKELAKKIRENQVKDIIEKICLLERITTFALSDFFSNLDSIDLSVVLLMDEFERIAGNKNFGTDFFYGLRALAIKHNLALVTSSYAELSTLAHSKDVEASPFFNIFATIHLGAFSQEETDELFVRYLQNFPLWKEDPFWFVKTERDFLQTLAGNFPYFLQMAGYFLFDAYQQQLSREERWHYTRRRVIDEANDDLDLSWRKSTDEEKITLTILSLLTAANNTETLPAFSKDRLTNYYKYAGTILDGLFKRGLVVENNGHYALFSDVFREWVLNELQANLISPQSYENWIQDSTNRKALDRLQNDIVNDVKDQILPKLKETYWGFIVSWLTNPATYKNAFKLLCSWLLL